MRARSRHINPKGLGAGLAFDSRFIAASNNDLLSSWTDRAARVSWTATGSARPTFKDAISGGAPMVLSTSGNRLTGDSAVYLTAGASINVLAVSSSNNNGSIQLLASIKSNANELLFYRQGTATYWAFRYSPGGRSWTGPSANQIVIELMGDGAVQMNGATVSSSAFSHGGSGNTNALANAGSHDAAWQGYIGQLIVINASLTAAQRKRLTHAAAFSFKIACS